MEKSTQWAPENNISPLSWCAMLLCIALFIYEHFWGNSFTTMVVMLYCSFMLPSVLLTRRVQEKYFIYTLEYIKAFRKIHYRHVDAILLYLVTCHLYAVSPLKHCHQ